MCPQRFDEEGTHLRFTPPHDSDSGPNHVDGQRRHDGVLDEEYGEEEPQTQHVGQSDGHGKVEADIPVSNYREGASDRREMYEAMAKQHRQQQRGNKGRRGRY